MRRASSAVSILMAALFLAGGAAFARDAARIETLDGVLTTVYEDPRPGSGLMPDVEYTLSGDSGEETPLLLDEGDVEGEPGGVAALDGERVEIVAQRTAGPAVEVGSISPAEPAPTGRNAARTAAAVTGPKPTATILCRFSDSRTVTPKPRTHFETLMGATRPGMDNYWREVSYNRIDLSGSRVFGWYDLPSPESYYRTSNGDMLEDRLAEDCSSVADPSVYFPDYTNVNFMVNTYYSDYALGGTDVLYRDGQSRVYGVTWMPRWGYQRESGVYGGQYILAHEMGHSFGLPHSSGPYSDTYDSEWDVMSDGSTCSPQDPQFGCLAVHTISAHKDKLGWVAPSRRYTASTAANQRVTLQRIARPGGSGYLMAKIPIGGSATRFYTVETRRRAGHDGQIPADAVVIHKIDTTNATGLTQIARVVDPDRNGDPNDAGARWLPGETFRDPANGISVRVSGATTGGYTVVINR